MEKAKEIKLESIKRTLDRMYSCRDLEISNLWQRSVFLGTFLVLCYTGYGFLINSLLEINKYYQSEFLLYHFVCVLLAMLSIVFSILWVQMAKGSKSWYEYYEKKIEHYQKYIDQREENLLENDSPSNVDGGLLNLLRAESEFGMGKGNFVVINDRIFSVKAGGYSPSKLNIVIGQVSLIVWLLVFISHISLFVANYFEIKFSNGILALCLFVLVIVFLWFLACILATKKSEMKIQAKAHNSETRKNCLLQSKFFRQVRSGFLHGD